METSKVWASRVRPVAMVAIVAVVTISAVVSFAGPRRSAVAASDRGGARCSGDRPSAAAQETDGPDRWSWLAGTTWYVPRSGLPALRYDPKTGASTPVHDQTVYTIGTYVDGYFSGKTVIQTTEPGSPSAVLLRNLVASVTPGGALMLTFVPPDPTGSLRATVGVGTFVCRDGAWSMEMQMSTGATSTLNHWAPMLNCRAGDRCNRRLPGTTMTLDEFTAQTPSEP